QRDESPVRHGLLVVHVDGEERSFVVGSRGQFELDLAGGVYQAQFVDARSSCALVLRIAEGESSIVRLGALECAAGLPCSARWPFSSSPSRFSRLAPREPPPSRVEWRTSLRSPSAYTNPETSRAVRATRRSR